MKFPPPYLRASLLGQIVFEVFPRSRVLRPHDNLSAFPVCPESAHVPSTTAPAPTPGFCLTSSGRRYEEGDGWHDGCRDCYCHAGREMCVLISCPVPSCSQPVVRSDQCCPTCEGTSRVACLATIVPLMSRSEQRKTQKSRRLIPSTFYLSAQSFKECRQLFRELRGGQDTC